MVHNRDPVYPPILFTVYMDGLLVKLRESGFGWYIGDLFLGVVAYCDDFLLLSPTPEMVLKAYDNFVKSMLRSIIFPFQQIQVQIYLCYLWTCKKNPVELVLNHQKLPCISQVDHLGHIIYEPGSHDIDCRKARGAYIGSSTELLGIFHFCSPLQKLSTVQTLLFLLWKQYLEPLQWIWLSNLPILEYYS